MASGLLKFFLPKDKVFYSLFEQASQNLEAIAGKLVVCVQSMGFQQYNGVKHFFLHLYRQK
jgi:hypothetical protein